MNAAMNAPRSPVQGVELWVPKDDVLMLRSGAYGPHTEFARVSGRSRFARNEGLPGAVWACERPLVWRDLSSHFVRAEHAAAAGIDAAIGVPWFRGRELAGVITLLITTRTGAAACVEVWNHDDVVDVLKHGDGIYVNVLELERLSALLRFPYAAGLPGLAWSTGMPIVIDDVRHSSEFVRAEPATRAGLKRAMAVPIFRERKVAHVLTLLGNESNAFPSAFELFVPSGATLVTKASSDQGPAVPGRRPSARLLLAQDAGTARMPIVADVSELSPQSSPGEDASSILLALPVHDGARLRGVLCLEF
jgi:hypothetical protein